MPLSQINIGLIGVGTVGGGVLELLTRHASRLTHKVGAPVVLKKVVDRDRKRALKLGIKTSALVHSWQEVVQDPSIHVVVELIGGTTVAKEIILAALKNGKHVVTANKALLAHHGREIFELARKKNLDVCFEAAVGGGIPILRSMREGFVANEIRSILAIINGTCNYILSEMTQRGEDFLPTLQKAQELGYAERDPSFDVDGIDASHKLAILASMAYGQEVPLNKIKVEGIRSITSFDIDCAQRFGFAIRLLAIAKKTKTGIEARVHPCMIPLSNPLAGVMDAFNAILIDGDYVGPSLLYGKGAGRNPTASAVVADIVEIARNVFNGVSAVVPPLGTPIQAFKKAQIEPIENLETEYYLRFTANDQPGVLSKITGILGKQGISISSVYQHGQAAGKEVPIVILTHRAREGDVSKAIAHIDRLNVVRKKTQKIRIEKG